MASRYLTPFSTARALMGGDLLLDLHREMNRLFDDAFRGTGAMPGSEPRSLLTGPSLDVEETDDELRITADLPGVKQSEVDLRIEGDRLTLSGERKNENEIREQNFHLMERSYGNFRRTVQLPFTPDPEKVEARFDNGVLNIRVAKQAQQERSRRIEVRGGDAPQPALDQPASAERGALGGSAGVSQPEQAKDSTQEATHA